MSSEQIIVEPRLGKILHIDPQAPRVFANYFTPDSSRWWKGGVAPRRDSYRQRCHKAERAFTGKVEHRTFCSLGDAAVYLRNFMETAYFQRRFPLFRKCTLEHRPGSRKCLGGPRGMRQGEVTEGLIALSRWGLRESGEIVLLHELAHAVLPPDHHHDRRWARTFIELVSGAMGFTMKQILVEEFRRQKVPFSPVRRVVASEAQVLRLTAVRAK